MNNACFKIQIIRQYLGKRDALYIKGFYINGAEKNYKVKFFYDEKELEYTEKRISDYEINNRYSKEVEGATAGSTFIVDVPDIAEVHNLSVIIEKDEVKENVLFLSKETVKDIISKSKYSIDVLEKIDSSLFIKGWAINRNDLEIKLCDNAGNEIEVEKTISNRNDVVLEYPELDDEEKAIGFQLKFDCRCNRELVLSILLEDGVKIIKLDTKSDFEGNRSLIVRIKKSINTRGILGTFIYALKKLKHPIKLLKAISRKIGLTKLLKSIGKKVGNAKNYVKDEYVLRTQYGNLRKKYPNATKKMIYLNALDEIKINDDKKQNGNVKFSILVPLYNTPVAFLKEMIESVQIQTYENWELCLADGSDEKHAYVGEICDKYKKKDQRIVYKKLDKNYGISGNTNECIKMATGNYIALFDHDDFLHPMVLSECYNVINKENADFVYTDEATFQINLNNVVTYHFKPDFAPDNLKANNYICHFSTFSKALLDEAGWYDSKYDGSQDHDLILRLTEKAKCVKHIPEILYFWRSHPGSVAEDINSKTYAINAGKSAVLASVERSGMSGVVESSKAFPTIYRIKYDLKTMPLISIIIPNCNHLQDLKRCVESIRNKSTYQNYEIIIAENNSDKEEIFEYYEELKKIQNIKVIVWDKPFNYSAINNYATKYAQGDYLLFLNNDIEVITPEWMEEMLMYAQRNDVAAVGAKLYYPDDTIQHAGIVLGMGAHRVAGHVHYKCEKNNLGYMGRLYYAQNMSAVTAACMLIKKSIFNEVNGFDEEFVVAYNDIDLCVKVLEAGYLNVFTPNAELYHYESASRGMEDTPEKIERFNSEVAKFKNKWSEVLARGDKYFNKNFSLDDSWFVFKENNLFKK